MKPESAAASGRAGVLLTRVVLTLAAALVVTSALAGPLSAMAAWAPAVAWLVFGVGLAAMWRLLRRVPSVALGRGWVLAIVGVAMAGALWAQATHSEHVFVSRDAASNLQAAISLHNTSARIVPAPWSEVGAADAGIRDGLTVASPGFYHVGAPDAPAVQPQFLVGTAALFALGWSVAGLSGATAVAALATALALTAAGLFAATVTPRPRRGVVAVIVVAGGWALFPVLHVARGTYSEPFGLAALVSGLLGLTLAARPGPARDRRRSGALAGLLVGGSLLYRIDSLREVLLLVPVLVVYAVTGSAWVRPLARWLAATSALALLTAAVLSTEYLRLISGSLAPLAIGGGLLVAAAVWVVRRWTPSASPPRRWLWRRAADVAGLGVLVVGLALASRPLWQVARTSGNAELSLFVGNLQSYLALAVDPDRTYAESTITWLAWYVGAPALGLALVASASAVRQAARSWGRSRLLPVWTAALVVYLGSTVLTLLRPGILPDHPWASRRLLLPLLGVVVLAVIAGDRLGARRTRGTQETPDTTGTRAISTAARWAPLAAVAALLAVGTLPVTWPHRADHLESGSMAGASRMCETLQPKDTVVMVDIFAAGQLSQVTRGLCGNPTVAFTWALANDADRARATIQSLAAEQAKKGGRVLLVTALDEGFLRAYGVAEPRPLVKVFGDTDDAQLDVPPTATGPFKAQAWWGVAAP